VSLSIDERVGLLRKCWLFAGCADEELEHIAALVEPRSVDAATEVLREGDAGDEFYVLVDGGATATVGGDVIEQLAPGSFFGEMALLDGGERLATVTTTGPSQLLVLDRHHFNDMLETAMPSVTPKLLQVVGVRMRTLAQHDGKPTLGY
jgi:CRP-like cAMP-binding protein